MHRRRMMAGLVAWPILGGALSSCDRAPDPKSGPTRRVAPRPSTQSDIAPSPSGLVELVTLDPSVRLDMRYATPHNFTGKTLYSAARAFLVPAAAKALIAAHHTAQDDGFGLIIYDAYRPLSVTRKMWNATPRHLRNYVANPAKGSRHNRGCAVDLTLYSRATNLPVAMPSDFDDFSTRAHRDFQGASPAALANRARLERYMVAAGFRPMSNEWWHFDFIGWEKYPIRDVPFGP